MLYLFGRTMTFSLIVKYNLTLLGNAIDFYNICFKNLFEVRIRRTTTPAFVFRVLVEIRRIC